jgi:branched-chain amino acid transport system substrate-binding protein
VSKDRALLRDALEQVQNHVGIGGTFNFSPTDHVGLNEEDLVMVRVENNEWKLITD